MQVFLNNSNKLKFYAQNYIYIDFYPFIFNAFRQSVDEFIIMRLK